MLREQRTYCQKESNIRAGGIVRNGEGHDTCKDQVYIPCKRYEGAALKAAQQIKVLAAKPEDPSSNLRTHMVGEEN